MASKSNTNYKISESTSNWHRCWIKSAYGNDIDVIESIDGFEEGIWMESTYIGAFGSDPEPIAIIDWKDGSAKLITDSKQISYNRSAIRLQNNIANKLKLPFFIILCFDDHRYDHKMYYVIPYNDIAREAYKDAEGPWLTSLRMSKFQAFLRGKTWNAYEPIKDENSIAVGMKPNSKQKDLPNTHHEYQLPKIELYYK